MKITDTKVFSDHLHAIDTALGNNESPPDFDLLDLAATIELAARRIEYGLLKIADAVQFADPEGTMFLDNFDGQPTNYDPDKRK